MHGAVYPAPLLQVADAFERLRFGLRHLRYGAVPSYGSGRMGMMSGVGMGLEEGAPLSGPALPEDVEDGEYLAP